MSVPQPTLSWMRRRPLHSTESALPGVHLVVAALTLSEKLAPFLQDADRALAENVELRERISQLEQHLRYSQTMQDAAADRIDVLEEETAVAQKEAALLRARMK